MILLDTLLIGGLKFVLGKVAEAVDAEMQDDSRLREELLAAQMRLELGEISDEEYRAIERDLLQLMKEVRARTMGKAETPGAFVVTGVEATFTGDEAPKGDAGGGGHRG